MSVCSLEDTHLSQDFLHLSIHSLCSGPIPSQIDIITIEDAEQIEELVIFPVDQDVEASPKHTTTTTVSPTNCCTFNCSSKSRFEQDQISNRIDLYKSNYSFWAEYPK